MAVSYTHLDVYKRQFLDKGRMAPLLRRMPVKVILNPHTPLFGAARFLDQPPG